MLGQRQGGVNDIKITVIITDCSSPFWIWRGKKGLLYFALYVHFLFNFTTIPRKQTSPIFSSEENCSSARLRNYPRSRKWPNQDSCQPFIHLTLKLTRSYFTVLSPKGGMNRRQAQQQSQLWPADGHQGSRPESGQWSQSPKCNGCPWGEQKANDFLKEEMMLSGQF